VPLEIINTQLKTALIGGFARVLHENPSDAKDGALRYGLARVLDNYDGRKLDVVGIRNEATGEVTADLCKAAVID
jgi:hypothetical protein